MLQNSKNGKNNEKNLKLMLLSGLVLVILFFYTMYKSSAHIQNSTYYVGLVFLGVLLVLALFARMYKRKIQEFMQKSRQNSPFAQTLQEEQTKHQNSSDDTQINIDMVESHTTFKDVAGIEPIKEELEEIVDFLNAPKKYLKFDVKLPKGVLLVGPPGVGKTLIARAVAGEAEVPFFYQSGASFVQIYVGMGAKRVRELFEKAKANAPSIIFIDEIDAIGKHRTGTSNDEREATLNELLTQMDGFAGDSGVIVIAATNKIEVLDDALLRAGRFDRRVHIGLPNIEDRLHILDLYLRNIPFDFDAKTLAVNLAGFSSASIATLINEAKLNMIKRNAKELSFEDIEIAKIKLEFGKKEQKLLNEAQRDILALYQASKAFITQAQTTLFQEGFQKEDMVYPSKSELLHQIKAYLAGFIGVEVIKHELYAVNAHDLKQADILAKQLVCEYHMASNEKEVIENVKNELRKELSNNADKIEQLKNIMLEKEVITQMSYKFFSGFSLTNEQQLFKEYAIINDFTMAGFSYGAIKAFKEALNTHKRVDLLQLFSPAFFQDKDEKFKRMQLMFFKKDATAYCENFLSNIAYPSHTNTKDFFQEGTFEQLDELLHFKWKKDELDALVHKGTRIEVYLGSEDKIIDSQKAKAFFVNYATVYYIKEKGHIL